MWECAEIEDLTLANWVCEGLYLKYCNSPKLMEERVLTTPGKSEVSAGWKHGTNAQERGLELRFGFIPTWMIVNASRSPTEKKISEGMNPRAVSE